MLPAKWRISMYNSLQFFIFGAHVITPCGANERLDIAKNGTNAMRLSWFYMI